jgi:hypothetical protein
VSPLLSREATCLQDKIIFPATQSTISAITSDYNSIAGGHPTISVFSEHRFHFAEVVAHLQQYERARQWTEHHGSALTLMPFQTCAYQPSQQVRKSAMRFAVASASSECKHRQPRGVNAYVLELDQIKSAGLETYYQK